MKSKRTISKTTIPKTKMFFNTIKNLIDKNEGVLSSFEQVFAANKNNQPWNTLRIAVNLGYLTRIKRGLYKMDSSLNDEQVGKIVTLRNEIAVKKLKLKDIKKDNSLNKTTTIKKKPGRTKYVSKQHRYLVCGVNLGNFHLYTTLEEAQKFAEQEASKGADNDVYVTEIKERYCSRLSVYKSLF